MTTSTSTISCDAGDPLLGGGFDQTQMGPDPGYIIDSRPVGPITGPTTWSVTIVPQTTGMGAPDTVSAVVVCYNNPPL
jgi:hypothetical protein